MQWFQERQIISALIWSLVHICHDGAGGGFKQQEYSVVKKNFLKRQINLKTKFQKPPMMWPFVTGDFMV